MLQVRKQLWCEIFCMEEKASKLHMARRTGKATVSGCGLNYACVRFVGKLVSNKAIRILGGHFENFPWSVNLANFLPLVYYIIN